MRSSVARVHLSLAPRRVGATPNWWGEMRQRKDVGPIGQPSRLREADHAHQRDGSRARGTKTDGTP